MPWVLTTCDNLKLALPSGGTEIEMFSATGTADLCALIGTPIATQHVILEVYTAQGNEQVVAYKCVGGKIRVTRAGSGTTAKDWPAGTCVRTVQIVPTPLCGANDPDGPDTSDPNCSNCNDSSVWDGLTVCPQLTVNTTVPGAPTLCLTPSGVSAGNYCGMRVDVYGRITSIPPLFPQTCIPAYDPCCEPGTGGGGASSAALVTYAPQVGGCAVSGTTVQLALEQLENVVCTLQATSGNIGVASISLCPALVNTGTLSNPNLCIAPTGVTPGTYDGFTVNGTGQVVSYVAPTGGAGLVAGTAPIGVTFGAGTYTVSVAAATGTTPGVVQYVLVSDIVANTVPNADLAVSYAALTQWWNTNFPGFVCGVPTLSALNAAQKATSGILICDGGTPSQISFNDMMRRAGLAVARGVVDFDGSIIASTGVATVTVVGFNSYTIVLSVPAGANYVVSVTPYNTGLVTGFSPRVTTLGPTAFTIIMDGPSPVPFAFSVVEV